MQSAKTSVSEEYDYLSRLIMLGRPQRQRRARGAGMHVAIGHGAEVEVDRDRTPRVSVWRSAVARSHQSLSVV